MRKARLERTPLCSELGSGCVERHLDSLGKYVNESCTFSVRWDGYANIRRQEPKPGAEGTSLIDTRAHCFCSICSFLDISPLHAQLQELEAKMPYYPTASTLVCGTESYLVKKVFDLLLLSVVGLT